MNSQNLVIILFLVAMGVALVGWRTVLTMTLTAGVTLAVLGLVEIATWFTATN